MAERTLPTEVHGNYVVVDGETTWHGTPGEIGWQLRYCSDKPHLVAASIVSAYAYLTDPNLPLKDAIVGLRRARAAVRAAASAGSPS